jgi:alanyl-tRNA synthetase
VGDPPRPVSDFAPSRPREEVRRFALKCLEAGAPWVVAGAAAPDPVIVIGRAKSLALDLKALVPELLTQTRGKGGGSPDLVQSSAADAAAAEAAWRWAAAALEKTNPG